MACRTYWGVLPHPALAVGGMANQTPGLQLEGHTKAVTAVAISADGRRVVSGSDDWSVQVWDV